MEKGTSGMTFENSDEMKQINLSRNLQNRTFIHCDMTLLHNQHHFRKFLTLHKIL